MKAKRIFAILIAVLMCISTLMSCKDNNTDTPSDTDGNTELKTESTTTAPPPSTTEPPAEDTPAPNEPAEKPEEEKVPTKFELQFSKENEELLAKILADDIEDGAVDALSPELSAEPAAKVKAGDNAWTYVYKNATKELYDEYRDALLKSGAFAQYTETEFNGKISKEVKNYFTTLISRTAQVDIGFHAPFSRMYVTITPRAASIIPMREAPEYTPIGDEYPTIWTQFGLEDINDEESSLGYILRIADGSFIILDSGEPFEGVEKRIYEILKSQAPDPSNIVISAWILTHAHSDHVGGFIRFAEQYGSDKKITVKQMVYNFPDSSNVSSEDGSMQNDVRTAIGKFRGTPEILKPHTGNVLYYADVTINILYTQEEHLAVESYFSNYNAASIVTQFVMADGTKLLIGADHPVSGSHTWCEAALWKWYGSFLESYVVSPFHHGYGGGADPIIYTMIKPKIVLWAVDQSCVDANDLTTTSNNVYFASSDAADRGVLGCYVAGDDIVILSFADKKATAIRYDTFEDYKAGRIAN